MSKKKAQPVAKKKSKPPEYQVCLPSYHDTQHPANMVGSVSKRDPGDVSQEAVYYALRQVHDAIVAAACSGCNSCRALVAYFSGDEPYYAGQICDAVEAEISRQGETYTLRRESFSVDLLHNGIRPALFLNISWPTSR